MRAEIITIGDELLIGQTIDTNSAWIGAELSNAGFDVVRKTSIHDKREDIINSLENISENTNVVIITGGLGPTSDDITKSTLCDFFDTRLVLDPEVLTMIENMMKRRGFALNDNNRRQAEVPESCRVLKNARGTAPGMWFEKKGTFYISIPGVPYEMKYIMTEHVLPELKERFKSQIIIHKNIMTYGTYEARLAEILTGFEAELPKSIKLAYLPSYGIIKLRLTGTGNEYSILYDIINQQVMKLYKIIPEYIFSEKEESMEKVTGNLLREKGRRVCTAESCTGGKVAQMITSVAGSSDYFTGSVVAYANSVKTRLLGVQNEMLQTHGAVSEQVVKMMAEGARKLFDSDYAVATSGIAGPGGGSDDKPVGTVWIAVASEEGTITEKHTFGSDRSINIERFSLAALNLLRKQIISK